MRRATVTCTREALALSNTYHHQQHRKLRLYTMIVEVCVDSVQSATQLVLW